MSKEGQMRKTRKSRLTSSTQSLWCDATTTSTLSRSLEEVGKKKPFYDTIYLYEMYGAIHIWQQRVKYK